MKRKKNNQRRVTSAEQQGRSALMSLDPQKFSLNLNRGMSPP